MVDQLMKVDGASASATLVIKESNYFLESDGLLSEVGLIEHIAQSASAFAGWKALNSGAENPPIGYIGEVKRFNCYRRPGVNEQLVTNVTFGPEVGGVTLIFADTFSGEEKVADTQMKIFVED